MNERLEQLIFCECSIQNKTGRQKNIADSTRISSVVIDMLNSDNTRCTEFAATRLEI